MYSILIPILFYDVWYYVSHIILHKHLYYIHKIHHAVRHDKLTYSHTNISHKIEHIITPLGIIMPYVIMEFAYLDFCIAYIFIGIRGFMRHDNRCIWLIGNHHILHHKYPKYNYGEYWMDSICGTLCPYKEDYVYGLIYI